MVKIKPFRGYRPRHDLVSRVISQPYDVITSQEARKLAEGNPISFLHVVKSEIDLDPNIDLYDPQVYETAANNLKGLVEEGVLVGEETPAFYVYQQKMGDHVQAGLVIGASAVEYQQDLIKKHEQTRKAKEADRTRHIGTLGANTGPVFLCYQQQDEIDALVDQVRAGTPTYDLITDDGVGHTLWVVSGEDVIAKLSAAFGKVPALYIADGHHRAASSAAICEQRKKERGEGTGEEPWNYFLAVAFPQDQLKIMGYHRIVRDLRSMSSEEFLNLLGEKFEVVADGPADPAAKGTFGMFLDGKWWNLVAKDGLAPADDPVASLDCAILQDHVLAPLLGITDPRTDKRVDFVGGIRGTGELSRRCQDEGWAVAFSLYPTGVEQLMAVADASRMMPPKSTWFEPKLRSGLIVRNLDQD